MPPFGRGRQPRCRSRPPAQAPALAYKDAASASTGSRPEVGEVDVRKEAGGVGATTRFAVLSCRTDTVGGLGRELATGPVGEAAGRQGGDRPRTAELPRTERPVCEGGEHE